jgi:hypothetical protein
VRRSSLAVLVLLAAVRLASPVPADGRSEGGDGPLALLTGDAKPARLDTAGPRTPPRLRIPDEATLRALVDSTSEARIRASIERLQAFETRYVGTDSCRASAAWLVDRFESLEAYAVSVDTFRTWTWQDSVEAWNVLAVRPGTTRPDKCVILGGHYDSVSFESLTDPWAPAPGADDNGSGVAAVLEIARVLARYETERTLVFACWSAEEEGLWGSRDFVARALEDDTDIILYMNLDAIGYNEVGEPQGIVYADSVSYAVAALAADIAASHLGLNYEVVEQPVGASDQNSFAEAGFRVLDTSSNPLYSPYHHSANDLLEHVDTGIVREVAAVNAAALASVALLTGEDENIPPETRLAETCAATTDPVGLSPTFSWSGVDFDGEVSGFTLEVLELDGLNVREETLGPDENDITLSLQPGRYVLTVAACDDEGARDPSPARHLFTATDTVSPVVTAVAPFLRDTLAFRGSAGRLSDPVRVFEGERLSLEVSVDPTSYCGHADRASISLSSGPEMPPAEMPRQVTLRPTAADTAVFIVAPEPDGGTSIGWIPIAPVPAPFDRGTLHVDDWFWGVIPEGEHDAFYTLALDGADTWDPYLHMEGGFPTLPPPEELGRYRVVVWTLQDDGGLLRAANAGPGWKAVEGYVRAGGNLVVEGQSAAATLCGLHPYDMHEPGVFLRERAGVDSVATPGGSTHPSDYGYVFMGADAAGAGLPSLEIDSDGLWHDVLEGYGGLPWCEVYRPTESAERLYLFDAPLSGAFDERPCGVLSRATDGAGSVALLGFPLSSARPLSTRAALSDIIGALVAWQETATLSFFTADTAPDSVVLSWYLDPTDGPRNCRLDRSSATGPFATVADSLVPGPTGRYRFVDRPPEDMLVRYRLAVTERSGAVTTHGPWEIEMPTVVAENELRLSCRTPASGSVSFEYSVAFDHRWVRLAVYDLAGRRVSVLMEGPRDEGRYEAEWNGRSASGDRVASGVYFARLEVGGESVTRKVVLLR